MTEPRYEQHVAAGAVAAQGPNATATVNHYYGTRLPAIDALPAPAAPDTAWLMAQPSRLLDARSHVVPFIGRTAELERLRQWRDARDARLSVLLLHAPGGQGKTRLATEFAELSRSPGLPAAERWDVLQAGFRGGLPGPAPSPSAGGAGVLLVVDYADRWAYSELEQLLADPVLHQQRPTRVLLIGRTVRWFAALRGELADRRADAGDLLLPSLDEDRLRMFTAARDRYGASDLYGLPDPADVEPPASLGRRDFGLTLNLHMAALVSVDARARGKRLSLAEPHELSAYLLDREYRAWQRLFDAGGQGQDYRTRPAIMAKTVFTAALTGAVDHDTGLAALRSLDLPGHPQDLLLDHRFCYPPSERELVLEPLYPDRLAEDFLGLLTPGHDVSAYDPDPWTSGVPAALLNGELRPTVSPRAVTFLASAADRWHHIGERVLYPLLRAQPGIAIAAGSPALTALAALADTRATGAGGAAERGGAAAQRIPPSLLAALEAVESHLPSGRHADLDSGILAVIETLIAHRLASTTDLAQRAWLYGTLAWRRANAGRREQAVAPAEEAVRLHRELAGGDPEHLPQLANALSVLGDRLSAAGRWEEALFLAEESVAISRRLAASDTAHQDRLADSLAGLGNRLSRHGRTEEALAVTQEAAGLYGRLCEADPVYRPDLAGLLNNLGMRLLDAGRVEEGLGAAEEAVELYRRLSDADPDAERHHFAMSLANLGLALRASGRSEEGLEIAEVATDLYRGLAEANPAAHQPDLTTALINLGTFLGDLGRGEEALAPAEEAVAIQRQLAETDFAAHCLDLAKVLNNLGTRLLALGHEERALAVTREADDLYRRLALAHPTVDLPEHADVRHRLALVPGRAGRRRSSPPARRPSCTGGWTGPPRPPNSRTRRPCWARPARRWPASGASRKPSPPWSGPRSSTSGPVIAGAPRSCSSSPATP
ncbi:tetratricopeptide repeat protein [Streptomyces sp. A0592]|uniref:tetratricopeptide repeat protein n=1 Tax=Streptomyces sp. A0592 TaxID=2563099 RepID=UPI00109E3C50|nr:tetratricopeptide repeat protein [Streptomyces sp. A0592]THA75786.1 tetratricopeptide repeat protein [Streptomyces sp. A0592]